MTGTQLLLLCGVIYMANGMPKTVSTVAGLCFLIAAAIDGMWRAV